jgi:hypothetical protein
VKAVILARAPHQFEIGGAFAEGLKRHGWLVEITNAASPCDLLVCWGIRREADIQAQKRRGGAVCILERGYLGDRFKWTSVSFGGRLNGRAEFRGVGDDPVRFQKHFGALMQPWRKQDGYALLIGQVPGDMSLKAVNGDLSAWYRRTAGDLHAKGYEVRFRPHPIAAKRGRGDLRVPGTVASEGTLEAAIAGAALVVTFNSNTAVESVLAGVPTMAADEGSMAWPVTSHAFEIVTHDRSEWAARLAWYQWTTEEMKSGDCWEAVKL